LHIKILPAIALLMNNTIKNKIIAFV
jgi:hypothetical protein